MVRRRARVNAIFAATSAAVQLVSMVPPGQDRIGVAAAARTSANAMMTTPVPARPARAKNYTRACDEARPRSIFRAAAFVPPRQPFGDALFKTAIDRPIKLGRRHVVGPIIVA